MARITMRNSQKTTSAQVFEVYTSAVTARGVKDKTIATYKQHFHAISKRLDAIVKTAMKARLTVEFIARTKSKAAFCGSYFTKQSFILGSYVI